MNPHRLFILLLMLLFAPACASGLGAPCSPDASCPEDLVCASTPGTEGARDEGVCDYPGRAEGEPCTGAGDCALGLTCSSRLFEAGARYGTCVPRLPDGATCLGDLDCQSGRCTGASGKALDGTCNPRG